jgi:hypothetical protein
MEIREDLLDDGAGIGLFAALAEVLEDVAHEHRGPQMHFFAAERGDQGTQGRAADVFNPAEPLFQTVQEPADAEAFPLFLRRLSRDGGAHIVLLDMVEQQIDEIVRLGLTQPTRLGIGRRIIGGPTVALRQSRRLFGGDRGGQRGGPENVYRLRERTVGHGNDIRRVRARCSDDVGTDAKVRRVERRTERLDGLEGLGQRGVPPAELDTLITPVGVEDPNVIAIEPELGNDVSSKECIARELVVAVLWIVAVADAVNEYQRHYASPYGKVRTSLMKVVAVRWRLSLRGTANLTEGKCPKAISI